jgi:hypothetical protein
LRQRNPFDVYDLRRRGGLAYHHGAHFNLSYSPIRGVRYALLHNDDHHGAHCNLPYSPIRGVPYALLHNDDVLDLPMAKCLCQHGCFSLCEDEFQKLDDATRSLFGAVAFHGAAPVPCPGYTSAYILLQRLRALRALAAKYEVSMVKYAHSLSCLDSHQYVPGCLKLSSLTS